MRIFETLVLLINAALILWIILPLRKRPRWMLGLSIASIATIALHLAIEHYRWQMLPSYGLSMLLLWLNYRRVFYPAPERSIQRIVSLALRGVVVLILFVIVALPIVFPVPILPPLTGRFEVGTISVDMIDPARDEIYTLDPDDKRQIIIQLWYPADVAPDAPRAPWIGDIAIGGPAIARTLGLPGFLLDHIALARTHSVASANVSDALPRYPVLVFSHGLGGLRNQNTFQVEELASHGYIVVGIDHTYGAAVTVFADGRVALFGDVLPSDPDDEAGFIRAAQTLVDVWAGDVQFVFDQLERFNNGELDPRFADRIDLDRIGVLGHSTGAGAAVEVCYRDVRCKVGLGMDAWVIPTSDAAIDAGLSQPFLFMHSATWSTPGNAERFDRLYDNLKGHAYQMTIAGTRHYDFTDIPLFSPLAPWLGLKGPLDGARVVDIINTYSLVFFDRYLKQDNTAVLNATPADYPEVTFESRP